MHLPTHCVTIAHTAVTRGDRVYTMDTWTGLKPSSCAKKRGKNLTVIPARGADCG